MNFIEGQGILGKVRFVDGEMPQYDRTYLVVNVDTDYNRSSKCFINKRERTKAGILNK